MSATRAPYSDRDAEEYLKPEHLAAWLQEIGADLVTVWPQEAHALGEMGILLPLDRFSGDGSGLSGEFYSSVLDNYQEKDALYALPVGADPLMLSYDADYFASMGLAPPNSTWDWDILVENALKLTRREEDGTVSRWGLIAHNSSIWWALWQNEAELADALTGAMPVAGTGRRRSARVHSRLDAHAWRLPCCLRTRSR